VPVDQIKQIAGRAGRYRTATQALREAQNRPHAVDKVAPAAGGNLGLVTTLHDLDLPYIQEAMNAEAPPLTSAGIQPPSELVRRFASYFPPSTPFRFVLKRLFDSSTLHTRNFYSNNQEQCRIADVIEDIKGMTVTDRYVFTLCPVNLRDAKMLPILRAYAKRVADRSGGGFLDIPELNLELLDRPRSGDKEYIEQLETLHRAIGLYNWLSFRFRGVFTNQAMAMYAKELAERQIERALNEFSANRKVRENLLFQRQELKKKWLEEAKKREDGVVQQAQGDASRVLQESLNDGDGAVNKLASRATGANLDEEEVMIREVDEREAMTPEANKGEIVLKKRSNTAINR
jgi:ATP-dependent RNA helicase SUPV3L1/SUV3